VTKQSLKDAQVLFLDPVKLSSNIVMHKSSEHPQAPPRSASNHPLEFAVPGYDMSRFSKLDKALMGDVAFRNKCTKAQTQAYPDTVQKFLVEIYR
jgi:hypothetical protein